MFLWCCCSVIMSLNQRSSVNTNKKVAAERKKRGTEDGGGSAEDSHVLQSWTPRTAGSRAGGASSGRAGTSLLSRLQPARSLLLPEPVWRAACLAPASAGTETRGRRTPSAARTARSPRIQRSVRDVRTSRPPTPSRGAASWPPRWSAVPDGSCGLCPGSLSPRPAETEGWKKIYVNTAIRIL